MELRLLVLFYLISFDSFLNWGVPAFAGSIVFHKRTARGICEREPMHSTILSYRFKAAEATVDSHIQQFLANPV
jgi:hypothetical protein